MTMESERDPASYSRSPRPGCLLAMALIPIVAAIGLASLAVYSRAELRALQGHAAYATPDEGALALVDELYSQVERVQVANSAPASLPDLWFVEVHVWAAGHADGKALVDRDCDSPGWFFLRTQNGWLFVPESAHPEVLALGKWLFRLSA